MRTALGRSVVAVIVGVVLFLLTGWAAGKTHLLLDWSRFQQSDALIFLGAYAQLVLAAAVFFQIRIADQSLLRQTSAEERAARVEKANAIVALVASAANARSLYVHTVSTLRNVTYNHGQEVAVERAEIELSPAESLRQQAHAARFRVEVLFAGDQTTIAAARELTGALDTQRQKSRAILAWSRTPIRPGQSKPDPQDVAVFPTGPEAVLLRIAENLVQRTGAATRPNAPSGAAY